MLATALSYNDAERLPELGQVWTPKGISEKMVKMAFGVMDCRPSLLIDPACGPATFEKALADTGLKPDEVLALDVDPRMANYTSDLINNIKLCGKARHVDYLQAKELKGKADMIVMNPPYIRQELLSPASKTDFAEYALKELGIQVNRRSNLLVYFLMKAAIDLRPGGVLCAIVYDSIIHSGYGKEMLKELHRIMEPLASEHISEPFEGALIDAHILLMRRRPKLLPREVPFESALPDGSSRLVDLLETRRGTGLPSRKVFLAKKGEAYYKESTPFIVKQAKIQGMVIDQGDARAYLVCNELDFPDMAAWLHDQMISLGKHDHKVRCRPVSAPILFNYFVRSAPRHLFNPKKIATSDNFYISSPVDGFPEEVAWLLLNSEGYIEPIMKAGRNQGNGLTKLQLYEYKSAVVPDWRLLGPDLINEIRLSASSLIKQNAGLEDVRRCANLMFRKCF